MRVPLGFFFLRSHYIDCLLGDSLWVSFLRMFRCIEGLRCEATQGVVFFKIPAMAPISVFVL